MLIALESIRLDGGTQPRASINPETVEDYRDEMERGAKFPPVVLFYDGTDHWLADGFHRYRAAQANGALNIEAEVHQGTRRDAVLYGVGANAIHGLPRTNLDKRRAVLTLLRDPEWCQWSDREIARRCLVDHMVVSRLRATEPIGPPALSASETQCVTPPSREVTPIKFTHKTGSVTTMKPRKPRAPKIEPKRAGLPAEFVDPNHVPVVVSTAMRPAWDLLERWPPDLDPRPFINAARRLLDRLEDIQREGERRRANGAINNQPKQESQ